MREFFEERNSLEGKSHLKKFSQTRSHKKRNTVTLVGSRLREIGGGSTERMGYSRLKATPTGKNRILVIQCRWSINWVFGISVWIFDF